MKIFNINDLDAIVSDQEFKSVALYDQGGKAVVQYNPRTEPALERLALIKKRLESEALPDGYYIVRCKSHFSAKNPIDYYIYKGQLKENAIVEKVVTPLIVEKPTFQPEVLTYEGALKLQIELERVKLENSALQKEIDFLKAEIATLEEDTLLSEDEQNKNEMFSNAKSFLNEAIQFVAPLLDKHFELKEKALGLKALEIKAKTDFSNRPKPSPEQRPVVKVSDWIATFENDADTYNSLVEIYNSAKSVEDFYSNLKAYDEQLFLSCTSYGK